MADGKQTLGLGTIMRAGSIVCAVVIAVVLLLWIRDEQGHVSRCAGVVQRQHAAMTSKPPMHVIVHAQAPNASGNGTAAPPVEGRWNYDWDDRRWADPKDAEGVPTRTTFLIRNGQHAIGTGRLTDRGRHQANLTAFRLRELNVPFDRIAHSDRERAAQTARLIHACLPHLPIDQDPMLAEGPRLEAAFRKYIYRADKRQTKDSADVLVTHGDVIRYIILRALQFPRSARMRIFLPHASISRLDILADGTVTLTQFGDSGHMPPEYVTY